jgi:hypothetical protein
MFSAINGVACSALARLNPDGSLVRVFTARFSNARFEEVQRQFELSRIDFAVRFYRVLKLRSTPGYRR